MKKFRPLWCLTALIATGTFFLAALGDFSASANNTTQTLPFSQNWTNTGLITANDDWAGVPGIVGYLGDIAATTTTNVDPRTLLADYNSISAVDVIANQTNPDTLTNGGVAEFEITNPAVALNGSGTADAPHIIVHLNTTGQSSIHFICNIRDLDGSADDAVQQVDIQYRVAGTGDYISVPGGYFPDVTTGGTATQVTAVNVTLPAAANNQSLVQVRVMTTNAGGNDEWIGIDDIQATGTPTVVNTQHVVDFNGDGKTDYAVARNVASQLRWFYNTNGTGAATVALDWGLIGDTLTPGDFDGDDKSDVAVWRGGLGTSSAFYILQSATSTLRIEQFGIIGDDATVFGDYDGDGKDDPAVYRAGGTSTWFYRGSLNPANITFVPWGSTGDKVSPGDYDGDGKYDFVIARTDGGNYRFWKRLATGTIPATEVFGIPGDGIVPGDYDGDGKTDLAVTRALGGSGPYTWFVKGSSGPAGDLEVVFGTSISDFTAQGDYDGDGKTDIAIWRTSGQFWSRNSSTGSPQVFVLGASNDLVIANYNRH